MPSRSVPSAPHAAIMRLLKTKNVPELVEVMGEEEHGRYAILSHTWEKGEEVSFQELSGDPAKYTNKTGYRKIQQACALAAQNGFDYAWVDTCCINKDASAELSEAINSMFRWYEEAAVCYVFLADLRPANVDQSGPDSESNFASRLSACKWFTRGWTLQELLAPQEVLFYDQNWTFQGDKFSLCELIVSITGIPETLLRHEEQLSNFAVARKMSWASRRKTTRLEDEAYCLLGIFGVHMSLLYGEGTRAFSRLQEAVLQETGDLSTLAWTDDSDSCPSPNKPCREFSGFFADAPSQFRRCSKIHLNQEDSIYRDVMFTTRGIRLKASLAHLYSGRRDHHQPVLDLLCKDGATSIGIYLRKIGGGRYARWNPLHIAHFDGKNRSRRRQSAPTRYSTTITIPPEHSEMPMVYTATALPTEKLLLPQKLEPSLFKFHPTNPVLGNRRTALKMAFNLSTSGLKQYALSAMPRSNWDRHDQVFFSTNGINKSWGAAFVEWRLPAAAGEEALKLELFVACFFWSYSLNTVTILGGLDGVDEGRVSALRHNLGRVKFEDTREAENLIRGTLGRERLCYESRLVVDVGGREVAVERELRKERCLEICANEMTFLNVSVSLAPRSSQEAQGVLGLQGLEVAHAGPNASFSSEEEFR